MAKRLGSDDVRAAPLPRGRTVFIVILLAVVATLPYLQTIRHDFIDYDDFEFVVNNRDVQPGLTWSGVNAAFTTFVGSNWQPLTGLTHMLDVQLWGMWAGGHHMQSVVWHAVNSALVFVFLSMLSGPAMWWRSAMAAVCFAVHPLHVESVAWIAERKDVVSTCFGLLALMAYIRYAKNRRLWRYALVLLFFALSLMAKPMFVTLPCVLLLLDVFSPLRATSVTDERQGASGWFRTWSWLVLEKLPLLVLSIAASIVTVFGQQSTGAMKAFDALPLSSRLANAVVAYGEYLWMMLWPAKLAVIYPWQPPTSASVMLAGMVLLMVSGLALWFRRNHPHVVLGWLWFLGMLVPVIGVIQVGLQAKADRYMYAPMIGLLIVLVWSMPSLDRRWRRGAAVLMAFFAAWLIGLFVLCAIQVTYWKDTTTLFTHTVAITERNHIAATILGGELRKRGMLDQARVHLNNALLWRPQYIAAHNNMGLLLADVRDFAGAERHFRYSLEQDEGNARTWNNLGFAVAGLQRHAEAIEHFNRAITLDPSDAATHVNLGRSLMNINQPVGALDAFQRAVEQQPELAEAHAGLGVVYWNMQRAQDAATAFRRALALRPDMLEARVSLGMALGTLGKLDEAIEQFELALRQNPNHANARRYLDIARSQREGTSSP